MSEVVTTLLTLVAETTTGEGALINTGVVPVADPVNKNVRPVLAEELVAPLISTSCRFNLTVSEITGTDMDFTIAHEIAGIDYELGTFTLTTGTESQVINIDNCPLIVKVKYVEIR